MGEMLEVVEEMTIFCLTKSPTETLKRFRLKGELVAFGSSEHGEQSFVLSVWLRWPNLDETYVIQLTHRRNGRVVEAICLPDVTGGKGRATAAVAGAVLRAETEPLARGKVNATREEVLRRVEAFTPPPSEMDRLNDWMRLANTRTT